MSTVLVNGFFLGLVYGLLAVGLVVVYRGSRIINFAYGETGMIGAFVFSELWVTHHVGLAVAVPAGVGLSAALGAVTERVLIRPLRGRPPLTAMVGTLAVATLILSYATRRYGLYPHFLPPLLAGDGLRVGGLAVNPGQLIILATSAGVLVGLWALHRFTAFGLRLRATAIDPLAAGLVGVNTDSTSMATWALAGGLAGLSGILIAPAVAFSVFFMTSLLLRSVAAALVGGLTSIGGALVAGVTLGLAEGLIGYLVPVRGLVEVVLAAFVIVLLLVRPSGLVRSAY
jgi:branched-subunit amino acid ABC-type transport system permease component